MKFDELRLSSGHMFQVVHVDNETDRMHAEYVGAVPGKAILITTPKAVVLSHDAQHVTRRLQAGDKLKIGLLGANGPASFATQVVSISGMPFPLVYLSYPSGINYVQSRKYDRVHVSLPVKVQDASAKEFDAELSDLSLSGGRILTKGNLGQIGDKITCAMTLEIDELRKDIWVKGTIRAYHQEVGEHSSNVFGVEFSQLSEIERLILRSFIHVSLELGSS